MSGEKGEEEEEEEEEKEEENKERKRRFSDDGALDVVGGGSGAEFSGIMVLLLKQVHLQNEGGAVVGRVSLVGLLRTWSSFLL